MKDALSATEHERNSYWSQKDLTRNYEVCSSPNIAKKIKKQDVNKKPVNKQKLIKKI
jgi:hypothetical protein